MFFSDDLNLVVFFFFVCSCVCVYTKLTTALCLSELLVVFFSSSSFVRKGYTAADKMKWNIRSASNCVRLCVARLCLFFVWLTVFARIHFVDNFLYCIVSYI